LVYYPYDIEASFGKSSTTSPASSNAYYHSHLICEESRKGSGRRKAVKGQAGMALS
jgi:hypothetical protein